MALGHAQRWGLLAGPLPPGGFAENLPQIFIGLSPTCGPGRAGAGCQWYLIACFFSSPEASGKQFRQGLPSKVPKRLHRVPSRLPHFFRVCGSSICPEPLEPAWLACGHTSPHQPQLAAPVPADTWVGGWRIRGNICLGTSTELQTANTAFSDPHHHPRNPKASSSPRRGRLPIRSSS